MPIYSPYVTNKYCWVNVSSHNWCGSTKMHYKCSFLCQNQELCLQKLVLLGCRLFPHSWANIFINDIYIKKCEKWRALADFSQCDSHRHISWWLFCSNERRWDFFVFWWWRRGEGKRKKWCHQSLDCYNNWWLLHPYNKISFVIFCIINLMYLWIKW